MQQNANEMRATTDPRSSPARLTVLYDEGCAVCLRCRDWLLTQPCLVPVELLPAGFDVVKERYGALPWLGYELVVVDEKDRVWIGPSAFLMCLWATARYRSWSYRLAGPTLAPLAERFFRMVSKRRDRWSARLTNKKPEDCAWCEQRVGWKYDR